MVGGFRIGNVVMLLDFAFTLIVSIDLGQNFSRGEAQRFGRIEPNHFCCD